MSGKRVFHSSNEMLKNQCTELGAFTVSLIIARNGPQIPLNPKSAFFPDTLQDPTCGVKHASLQICQFIYLGLLIGFHWFGSPY